MFEIALLFGLVNAWTLHAEQYLLRVYNSNCEYIQALHESMRFHPSMACPIMEFLKQLRDDLLDGKIVE